MCRKVSWHPPQWGWIKTEDSVQDRSVRKCEFLPRGNGPVASRALEHAKLKTAHYMVWWWGSITATSGRTVMERISN